VIASWRVIDVPFGPEEGYRWVEVAPADAVTTIAVVPPPPGGSTGNRETGIGLHESPAAIKHDNDEDQRTLKRGTLTVREERYAEAELH
jgi:hypothetical protein